MNDFNFFREDTDISNKIRETEFIIEPLSTLVLYNDSGEIVLEKTVVVNDSQRPESQLNLSNLKKGKYLLQVRNGDDYYNKDICI